MNRVLLYSIKRDDLKVTIEAYFDEANNLVIEGYDIGKVVAEHWGDSDYEYSTTIRPDDVKKVYALTGVADGSKDELLIYIQANYNDNSCYSAFRDFLSKNNIAFESFSWT